MLGERFTPQGSARIFSEWEDGHYQPLLREDEALRDDYWSENRFSPLL